MNQVFEFGNKKVFPIIYHKKYGQMSSINCYLYQDQHTLTLIDAGIDTADYEAFFMQQLAHYSLSVEDIDQIILTHHHVDHIGMVNKLLAKKQMPIFAHTKAIERLALTVQYQLNKIAFFEALYTHFGCANFMQERLKKMKHTLQEDSSLKIQADVQALDLHQKIGDLNLLETPGHSPDSISLIDQETGWLFAGDCIIEKGTTNALIDFDEQKRLLPTVLQHRQSMEHYLKLHVTVVFAGHEQIFGNLAEVAQVNLSKIDYKVQRIIKQVEQGNDTVVKIANALYGQLMVQMPTLIFSEVIGYIDYAEKIGLIESVQHNRELKFRSLSSEA